MLANRLRMFGIGTIAALALGLWQAENASAQCYSSGYGRTYYSSSYDSGGCRPVYVEPPCYPTRTYYSSGYDYPRPYRSGFSFSFSSGGHHDYGGHHSYGGRHGYGGHHGGHGGHHRR